MIKLTVIRWSRVTAGGRISNESFPHWI